MSPLPEEEPPVGDLDVDYQYFDEKVWPILAKKVPAFNSIKVSLKKTINRVIKLLNLIV